MKFWRGVCWLKVGKWVLVGVFFEGRRIKMRRILFVWSGKCRKRWGIIYILN